MLGLLTFTVLGLASCTEKGVPQEDHDRERSVRRKTEQKLEEAEKTIKTLEDKVRDGDALEAKHRKLETESQQLREGLESSTEELEALKKEFDTYKSRYRISMRTKLLGSKIASITTKDGKQFSDCTIKDLTPVALKISHSAGSGRIQYKDLPDETAEKLGYEAEVAAAYLAKEPARSEEKATLNAKAIEQRKKAIQAQNVARQIEADRLEQKKLKAFLENGKEQMRLLQREASKLSGKAAADKSRGRVTQAGVHAAAAQKRSEAFRARLDKATKRLDELDEKLDGK